MYKRLECYKNELLISLMIILVLFSLLFSMNYQDISELYFTRINITSGTEIILKSYSDYIYYLLPITSVPSIIYLYVFLSRRNPMIRKKIKLLVTGFVIVLIASLINLDLKTSSITFATCIDATATLTIIFLITNVLVIVIASAIALKTKHHKKIFINFLLSQLVLIVGILLIFQLINEIILMLYIVVTIFQSIWVLCKFDEELLK